MVDLRSGKSTSERVSPEMSAHDAGPPGVTRAEMKLTSFIDHKEEKVRAEVVKQLAFTPVRGDAAIAFKRRAQDRLQGLPDELQLQLLLRAVGETNEGSKWLYVLKEQEEYPASVFWALFDDEWLSFDALKNAHSRFIRMRMTTGQSVSSFVDEFRDVYVNLLALGAPSLPDQWLYHAFLNKLPLQIRSMVEAQLAGEPNPTTADAEKIAVMVGAASVTKPARLGRMKVSAPVCFACGEPGHVRAQCPKKQASKPADERGPRGKGSSQKN